VDTFRKGKSYNFLTNKKTQDMKWRTTAAKILKIDVECHQVEEDNYWRWNYWVIILLLNTFGGENVQMSYANIRTNEWRKWRS
jgi:hypothetical protein